MSDVPVRVQILQEGARLTAGDREVSYGSPINNLGLAGALKAVFRAHVTRCIGPAEQEAIDMVLTKIGRLACGGTPSRDTYIDLTAYAAIAGEVAEMESENLPHLVDTADEPGAS